MAARICPTVHRAQLRFGVGYFDRHGVVGISRRPHVMVRVDAPALRRPSAHVFGLRIAL
jgi:hypothetical protein